MIHIHISSPDGIYTYRQKSGVDLYNLCEMMAFLIRIDFSLVVFAFNGKRIDKGDTPLSVGMQKGVINYIDIY